MLVFGSQPSLLGSQSLVQLAEATGSLGQHILHEAWSAFRQELQAAHDAAEVSISNLPTPATLASFCDLCNPHQPHQAVRNFFHLIIQSLTLLAVAETNKIDLLRLLSGVDGASSIAACLGLCSGSLAAYCFATSRRPSELIHMLVETSRLAFWMGLRVTQAALDSSFETYCANVSRTSAERTSSLEDPWCLFVQGCSLAQMQLHLYRYSVEQAGSTAAISADKIPWIAIVFNEQRVSVAGPPDSLNRFRSFLQRQSNAFSLVLRAVSLHAPYHSAIWLSRAVKQLRSDMISRKIRIAASSDLLRPIFDNHSGEKVDNTSIGINLPDSIISNMLLAQARWDLVLQNVPQAVLKKSTHTQDRLVVLNAGPDYRLAKDVAQALSASLCLKPVVSSTCIKILGYNEATITYNSNRYELTSQSNKQVIRRSSSAFDGVDGRPPQDAVAVTAFWFADTIPSRQDLSSHPDIQAAAQMLHAKCGSSSLLQQIQDSGFAYFFDDDDSVDGGQFVNRCFELLRHLSSGSGWPHPSLIGRTQTPGIMMAISKARQALLTGMCHLAIAAARDYDAVSGQARDAFVVLQRIHDQDPSTASPALILHTVTAGQSLTMSKADLVSKFCESAGVTPDTLTGFVGSDACVQPLDLHAQADSLGSVVQGILQESVAVENAFNHVSYIAKAGNVRTDNMVVQADAPTRVVLCTLDRSNVLSAMLCESVSSSTNRSSTRFVGLSGSTMEECNNIRHRLHQYVSENGHVQGDVTDEGRFLDTISYSSLLLHGHNGNFRIGLTANTRRGLLEALEHASPSQVLGDIDSRSPQSKGIAFVFSGQGCQYPKMAADLYKTCPPFQESMQRCDRISRAQGFPGFISTLYAEEQETGSTLSSDDRDQALQLAIFAIEVSLAELLISMSVQPAIVTGHSLGFYAAAHVAGIFSLADAIYLVARRSALFRRLCSTNHSQMLALAATEQQAMDLICSAGSQATIACYNGPTDLVLSGTRQDLTELCKRAKDSGLQAKLLEVPFGFHSSHVEPACEGMLRAAELIHFAPPKIAITSNVLGRVVQVGERDVFNASYLSEHIRCPVRFASAIDQIMRQRSSTDWVELGPNPICLPMIKATAIKQQVKVQLLPAMRRNADNWSTLVHTLGAIWSSGGYVSWEAYLKYVSRVASPAVSPSLAAIYTSKPSLQTLPSRRSSLFDGNLLSPIPSRQASGESLFANPSFASASTWMEGRPASNSQKDSTGRIITTTPLSSFQALVSGHKVVGHSVFSASLHSELAVQGLMDLLPDARKSEHAFLLKDLSFQTPLVLPDAGDCEEAQAHLKSIRLQVALEAASEGSLSGLEAFAVQKEASSRQDDRVIRPNDAYLLGQIMSLNNRAARARMHSDEQAKAAPKQWHDLEQRRTNGTDAAISSFDGSVAYDIFGQRVLYCKDFQAIESVTIDRNSLQACATLRLAQSTRCKVEIGSLLESAFTDVVLHDVMLHAGGMLLSMSGVVKENEAFIGAKVGEVLLAPKAELESHSCLRLLVTADATNTNEMLTDAFLMNAEATRVLGWARRVAFKKVRRASLEAALARACIKVAPLTDRPSKNSQSDHGPGCSSRPQAPTPVSPKSGATMSAVPVSSTEEACALPFSDLIPLLKLEVDRAASRENLDIRMAKTDRGFEASQWPDPDAFLLKMFPALRGATLCA